MKVAVNKCYGGFSLSDEAHEMLVSLGVKLYENWERLEERENKDEPWIVKSGPYSFGKYSSSIDRTDERLIKTIEKLGKKASGMCGNIKVIDIPDGIEYEIDDYDGFETVREKHRSW